MRMQTKEVQATLTPRTAFDILVEGNSSSNASARPTQKRRRHWPARAPDLT